tara:strand:+ start:142 stop:849 length:708 start_codon:yes stop_codon:yes gene_type:complete
MTIRYIFPTPVYLKQAVGNTLKTVNEDLWNLYDPDGMAKNVHTYNHTSSHEVSTDEEGHLFASNIVKETPNFAKFLERSILGYLSELGMKHPIPFAITESWFTKTSQNQHAPIHSHGNSDISGVYYLQTNGADGELAIRNPLNACNGNLIYFLNSMKHSEEKMPLKKGLLMMWPSTLEHSTYINQTPEDRISVSFNVSCALPPFMNTNEGTSAHDRSHLYFPFAHEHIESTYTRK